MLPDTMKTLAIPFLWIALATPAWSQEVVLARNEWTTVTKADFDAEIARIPKEQQFGFLSSAERVGKTVEAILINKTLAAQARADGLQDEPAVKAELASAVVKVLARNRIERAEAAMKEPDFSRRAEELYKANLRKYAEKDIYHTMHVLVDAKCRTPEAAKARALEARAEIEAGKPFAEVARKYSDDPSVAKNGGDIGPILFDNLSPPFAESVQVMKAGELSQPVLTNFGYHIIKLVEAKKGRQYAFAEVRESIIAEVKEEWLKQQRKEFVEAITADPKLKLNVDAIRSLKTSIDAPAPPPPKPSRPG